MKMLIVLLMIVLLESVAVESLISFPSLDVIHPRVSAETQAEAAFDVINRLIPDRSSEFSVTVNPDLGPKNKDTFRVIKDAKMNQVHITGSSGVAVTWGFLHYLKYYCHCHISWDSDQLDLPTVLPAVAIKITSNDRFRYYQNTCTSSYSFAWWKWDRWQREIDWMAMNGINLPLAFVGQEAIWERVFLSMGLNQTDIDDFLVGPAFFAWGRMGNLQKWGGPLNPSWHNKTVALQHQILESMRSLGMIAVAPAFAGFVPQGMESVYPNATYTRSSDWNGFGCENSCVNMVDPTEPLFQQIGAAFLTEYIAEFGSDHVYSCDTFNENQPSSGRLEYLTSVGNATFQAMVTTDPKAIWLMQGWLFQDEGFWKPLRVKAYVTSVPQGRMIVLDLHAELSPQYARLNSFYGQPFIWCMLLNFGGTLGLYGSLDNVNSGVFVARDMENSTMIGTGLTPEGINQNYAVFDFMNEMAWRTEEADLDHWMREYAWRRYGRDDNRTAETWQILRKQVLNTATYSGSGQYIIVKRPTTTLVEPLWYNVSDLITAWGLLTEASDVFNATAGYRHDLVDVTREVLQNLCAFYYTQMNTAFAANKTDIFRMNALGFLETLLDMDLVLGTSKDFLLGRWLDTAKGWATDQQESELYEYNARNQITLWGPNGEIKDYASKQWNGVVSTYYYPRWSLFISYLNDSLINGTVFSQEEFNQDVFQNVEQPFTMDRNLYPVQPQGDTISIVKEIHQQWAWLSNKSIHRYFDKMTLKSLRYAAKKKILLQQQRARLEVVLSNQMV